MMIKLAKNGTEIESWCIENNYTKEQLAFELGVTRQTLFNWTKNQITIPRVVALSLFAIQHLPIEARSNNGIRVRKKTKIPGGL